MGDKEKRGIKFNWPKVHLHERAKSMCLHFVRHVKIINKDELRVRRLRGCWSQGLQPSVMRNYDNRMNGICPGTVTLLTSGT